MERKNLFILLAIFMIVLAVAGYFYYPNIEENPSFEVGPHVVPRTTKIAPVATITSATKTLQAGRFEKERTPLVIGSNEVIGAPGREISVTVRLTFTVSDVEVAATKASSIATSLGGYIQSSSISDEGGYIILKVPRERLSEALSLLKSLGKLEREEFNTIDLTNSIVDVDARLRNAKAEEGRLLELLNKAENMNDILEIEGRLSAVREKIERLEAMKKGMERRVDYSTIQLELRKKGVRPSEDMLSKIMNDAYRALMGSIYIIVVGGAFLLIPAIIAVAAYLIIKRRHGNLA